MEVQMNRSVRFRVDPTKIRIRVRHIDHRWCIKATNLSETCVHAILLNESVSIGMFELLDKLNEMHVDGYNFDLMTAYSHPQFKE